MALTRGRKNVREVGGRSLLRTDKLTRQKKERSDSNPVVSKIKWIQENLPEDKTSLTEAEIHSLIHDYLRRNDEEILEFMETQRKNRPKPGRFELLESLQQHEEHEYDIGSIEFPDLTQIKVFQFIKNWPGDLNTIKQTTFRMFKRPKLTVSNTAVDTTSSSSSDLSSKLDDTMAS